MKLSFSQLDLVFLCEEAGSEGKRGREFSFLKLFQLTGPGTLKRMWDGQVGSAVIFKALRVE